MACESGPVYKSINMLTDIIPAEFELYQNAPNPFNPATDIGFSLPVASHVSLEIYNLLGQKVVTLVNGFHEAGYYSVTWDASREASGIYIYRITAGENTAQKKMVFLK
jgi:hypothetical protein